MQQVIEAYINEAVQALRKLGLKVDIHRIEYTDTVGRSLGTASINDGVHVVRISSRVYKHDSPCVRQTCFHEVCHIADWQNFNGWGHGRTWKRLMRMLGMPDKAQATAETVKQNGHEFVESKRTVKRYWIKCGGCGTRSSIIKRQLNNLHRYACSRCKSRDLQPL